MARRALPGFGLSLGFTLAYLSLLVVIPLSMIVLKTAELSAGEFIAIVTSARALAALRLSLSAALGAAAIATVLGTLLAWVLVRYDFPGKKLIDGLVDLPFALPTAVAGIALAATWGPNGPLGKQLAKLGIQTAYSRTGIVIALVFIGLPFVVRAVQPVLAALDPKVEEVAATLGATRAQTIRRVILPALRPAIATGFALAFARGLGEYGSVVFMSGNMPLRTEVAPLLVMNKLEQFDYAGATALALVMLVASGMILLVINRFTIRTYAPPGIRRRPAIAELAPAAVPVAEVAR
jgi:sulfate transport system permease protein